MRCALVTELILRLETNGASMFYIMQHSKATLSMYNGIQLNLASKSIYDN
jgi:hypothetical protein